MADDPLGYGGVKSGAEQVIDITTPNGGVSGAVTGATVATGLGLVFNIGCWTAAAIAGTASTVALGPVAFVGLATFGAVKGFLKKPDQG